MADCKHLLLSVFVYIFLNFQHLGHATRIYKAILKEKSWTEARKYCKQQHGDLAILRDLNKNDFERMSEFINSTRTKSAWVGGRIQDQGWNWYDQSYSGSLKPLTSTISSRGCFHSSRIIAGIPLRRITADKCFKKCGWKGAVALKKFYCICEKNLRNLSRISPDQCDTVCDGNPNENCGGPFGVSVYQMNNRAVLWAKEEPKLNRECVYVRRNYENKQWKWFSSSCNVWLKYMCRYDNHHICGVEPNCVRPSTTPETWEGAVEACRRNNATIAVVDIAMVNEREGVISFPPGEFWVGLRRRTLWKWTDGTLIPDFRFHGGKGKPCSDDKCTTLHKTSNVKLSPEPCEKALPFVCEFKIPQFPNDKWSHDGSDDPTVFMEEVLEKDKEGSDDATSSKEDMYKSVMYIAIGVAIGMTFVFSVCIIAYIAKKCRKKGKWRTRRHKGDNFGVCSISNNASTRNSSAEVLYDIPCDTQSESPFRRTQRALRQESMREVPPGLFTRGSENYRSGSWRRLTNGSQKEVNQKERMMNNQEIRTVYPQNSSERSFRDASYIIHKVQAQCHGMRRNDIDVDCEAELVENERTSGEEVNDEIRLADTYSQPGQSRKTSENDPIFDVDTSDLYSCVQKVINSLSEDRLDQI